MGNRFAYLNKNVGERLKEIRERSGLSLQELADEIGDVNANSVAAFEAGLYATSTPFLIRFHEITGVNLNYILLGDKKYLEAP